MWKKLTPFAKIIIKIFQKHVARRIEDSKVKH